MNVERFSLALCEPLVTARGQIDERSGYLLSVTHRGHRGTGEATPLAGWTESDEACAGVLESAAAVARSDGIDAARRRLPADAPAARHGVSTAVLDADARAEDVPLYAWFDEDRSVERVPVNATVGDADPERTAATAEEAVDAGFSCCKVKVGTRPVPEDLQRLHSVRAAIGDGPALRVDANGAWTREQARTAVEELADISVEYVEQPLDPDDLDGHARLRDGPVDVALDESLVSHGVDAIFEAEAADALVLKPMVLGGPGEAYALSLACREEGVEPVVSNTVDAVVARTAAVHVAAAIPEVGHCGLATADRLATDLGPDPVSVRDGEIVVPQDPGLGLDEVSVDG